jgi:hypothetical protein
LIDETKAPPRKPFSEGQGWAKINPAATPNTYTSKGSRKRD